MRFFSSLILMMLITTSVFVLVSCGDSDDSTNVIIQEEDDTERQEEQGPVSAGPVIKINNTIENNVKVTNKTRVEDRDIHINWQCRDVAPVVHQQFIHISVRCPTLADDTNGDGVVDQVETQQVIGPGVFALDQNAQSTREEQFPQGSQFDYDQRIPLSLLRRFVPQGETFVVMFYGAEPTTQLPPTYSFSGPGPANLTIPKPVL